MAFQNQPGCGCCDSGGCDQPFHVIGCRGQDLSGATVDVQDSGGTSLASGTTDSSGDVTLSLPSSGTYTVVTSKTGVYSTITQTLTLDCSAVREIDQGPAFTPDTLEVSGSGGECQGFENPSDTLTYGDVPGPAQHNTSATKGWIGSTEFGVGGALGFQDYIYIFVRNSDGSFSLYAYTASGDIVAGMARNLPVTCEPFLWGATCGANKFEGTISEP